METRGANCLSAARAAGRRVTLGAITSAATSLGALAVQGELLQACLDQVSTAATPSLHDDNPGDDFMNFLESNSDCERVLILIIYFIPSYLQMCNPPLPRSLSA